MSKTKRFLLILTAVVLISISTVLPALAATGGSTIVRSQQGPYTPSFGDWLNTGVSYNRMTSNGYQGFYILENALGFLLIYNNAYSLYSFNSETGTASFRGLNGESVSTYSYRLRAVQPSGTVYFDDLTTLLSFLFTEAPAPVGLYYDDMQQPASPDSSVSSWRLVGASAYDTAGNAYEQAEYKTLEALYNRYITGETYAVDLYFVDGSNGTQLANYINTSTSTLDFTFATGSELTSFSITDSSDNTWTFEAPDEKYIVAVLDWNGYSIYDSRIQTDLAGVEKHYDLTESLLNEDCYVILGDISDTPDPTPTPTPTNYTVVFNSNGGSAIENWVGTSLPDPLPTPTRSGYAFRGWFYDNSSFLNQAYSGQTLNTSQTTINLYAAWLDTAPGTAPGGNGQTGPSAYDYYIAQNSGDTMIKSGLASLTATALSTILTIGNAVGIGGVTLLGLAITAIAVVLVYTVFKLVKG